MAEKYERHSLEKHCPAKAHEEALITVPIHVDADAHVHDVGIYCVGEPVKTCDSDYAPGHPGAKSKFTVSQRIRLDIPIDFDMFADIGEAHVKFDCCEKEHKPCDKPHEKPCDKDPDFERRAPRN